MWKCWTITEEEKGGLITRLFSKPGAGHYCFPLPAADRQRSPANDERGIYQWNMMKKKLMNTL